LHELLAPGQVIRDANPSSWQGCTNADDLNR